MAISLDFAGLGDISLKASAWTMWAVMAGAGFSILGACVGVLYFNTFFFLDLLIERLFIPWYAIANWAVLAICLGWGFVAISLPCRPRESKSRALTLFTILIFLHAVSHTMWIVLFLKRCHNFFLGSLAGNLLRNGVEAISEKLADKDWVQDALYVAVPVMNFLSAPLMYSMYRNSFPPLHLGFLCGWNWALVAFALGVVPVIIDIAALVVVLGYKNAIDLGGDGNERVPPTKLAYFYSLPFVDRSNVRNGAAKLDDYEFASSGSEEYDDFDKTSSESSLREVISEEGSGGTRSISGSEEGIKRIPSYKPNRRMVV